MSLELYNCRLCGRKVDEEPFAVSLHNIKTSNAVTFDICLVCMDKIRTFLQTLASPNSESSEDRKKDILFLKGMGIIR